MCAGEQRAKDLYGTSIYSGWVYQTPVLIQLTVPQNALPVYCQSTQDPSLAARLRTVRAQDAIQGGLVTCEPKPILRNSSKKPETDNSFTLPQRINRMHRVSLQDILRQSEIIVFLPPYFRERI